jgi:hypothetical protein
VGLVVWQTQSIMVAPTTRGLLVGDLTSRCAYARRKALNVTFEIIRRASLARTRTQPYKHGTHDGRLRPFSHEPIVLREAKLALQPLRNSEPLLEFRHCIATTQTGLGSISDSRRRTCHAANQTLSIAGAAGNSNESGELMGLAIALGGLEPTCTSMEFCAILPRIDS